MLYSLLRRICGIFFILSIMVIPVACGTAKKIPEYKSSRLLPPLEIPPDLDKPVYNERMKIPEPPVTDKGSSGGDASPDTHSIEEPPVFLEESDSKN
jgi:hypothetical protein